MFNPLNETQSAHTAKANTAIRSLIETRGGWIGFDEFMNQALYGPQTGYYTAGAEKFGEQGDFVTAPMISSLFGYCLARQAQQVLALCDGTRHKMIVEFGAGTGRLMFDILSKLNELESLPDEIVIVELSPDLRSRQEQILQTLSPKIMKTIRWAEVVDFDIHGVVLGNELLDAFAVKKFVINKNSMPMEMGVRISDDGFDWQVSDKPMSDAIAARLAPFDIEPGYQGEVGLAAEAWVESIGERLTMGAMILIDYGYPVKEFYHWDRNQGTLMCHFQHKAHTNPFLYPGLQDITSHVDFSTIADSARSVGLDISGYCSQAHFLLSLELLNECEETLNSEQISTASLDLAQQVKKLTLPHEMGELFKVIAFTRGIDQALKGFDMKNVVGTL